MPSDCSPARLDPHAGEYAITAGVLGQSDIASVDTPEAYLEIEGLYRRSRELFCQSGNTRGCGCCDNGVFILNTEKSKRTRLVHQHMVDVPEPRVFAIGPLLVTSAEGSSAELLDISDPAMPQPIPGGRFDATDSTGACL